MMYYTISDMNKTELNHESQLSVCQLIVSTTFMIMTGIHTVFDNVNIYSGLHLMR